MQFLKLVECGHHVFFRSQLFCRFAQMSLYFEILFEVIFAEFVVQFKQIVELFYIQVVALPQLIYLSLRDRVRLVPLLLKLFEFRIRFVGVVCRFYELFQFLENGEFDLQVLFFPVFQLGSL